MKPVLAIISPALNVYSETFIQAHKNIPGFEIKYYYNGHFPKNLEGVGELKYTSYSFFAKLIRLVKRKLKLSKHSQEFEILEESFKKENITAVLAEYGPTGATMCEICKKMKLPLFVHFHGYDAVKYDVIKKYGEGYKHMFNYASAIFSVSNVMTQKLVDLGCPHSKIIFNIYGLNRDFFEIKPSYKEELFISVGRFVDKKAPYYTLLAFKQVLEKFPNAQLVMAGDGLLLNTIQNLIKYYKLEENVKLIGIVNREIFMQYLSNARAFVQHSITALDGDMEGTPVAILEACAAGLPVISTYHAGIPDILEHKKTGLLCDEHDVYKMTENMLSVLDDINLAKKIGNNAKLNVKSKYTMEQHLELISKNILYAIK